MYKWLDVALDYGISEADFWDMSIGELQRAIRSKHRVEKVQLQEKATFNYILADLIGKSISRLYSSANTMPDIAAVYPTLFDSKEIEEKKRAKKEELSVLRFKLFANSHNKKYAGGANDKQ